MTLQMRTLVLFAVLCIFGQHASATICRCKNGLIFIIDSTRFTHCPVNCVFDHTTMANGEVVINEAIIADYIDQWEVLRQCIANKPHSTMGDEHNWFAEYNEELMYLENLKPTMIDLQSWFARSYDDLKALQKRPNFNTPTCFEPIPKQACKGLDEPCVWQMFGSECCGYPFNTCELGICKAA